MCSLIKKLYDALVIPAIKSPGIILSRFALIRIIKDDLKIDLNDPIIKSFITYINGLDVILVSHIEQFCFIKTADYIINEYPINIAEAYIISYLILNGKTNLNFLYFKLGTSGLLAPTFINDKRIEDLEEVARLVIESLANGNLIIIENQSVYITPDIVLK